MEMQGCGRSMCAISNVPMRSDVDQMQSESPYGQWCAEAIGSVPKPSECQYDQTSACAIESVQNRPGYKCGWKYTDMIGGWERRSEGRIGKRWADAIGHALRMISEEVMEVV